MTKKNPAAVKLGSLGGKLLPRNALKKSKKAQAREAAAARWARGKS
jgi:hypothetical protein